MVQFALKLLLNFYRLFISPVLGSNCRYYPSCSQYALEALDNLPLPVALYRIIARLLRCNPWADGGYDPLIK